MVPGYVHNSLCEHKQSTMLNMMMPPNEDVTGKRAAVSYLRFSTPEQALGDSERRQIALAEAYCARNGLALSKEAVADRGRSAYHGAHRTAGNLGALLKRLKPGQVLLIEDCDRWSREPVIDSLTALRDTVRKGIEVVFMRTGTRVTAENFDSPEVLYPNFFGSVLANTESKKKGERLQAGWQAKHTKARTGQPVRLNRPPCWLRWNQDAGKYEEDKAKAAVVRSLFELAGAGHGLLAIVRIMKAKRTPPLTTGASAAWNLSTLRRILLSKEALGYYCPTDGSQPAPGFYPPVVSEKVFYAAQGRLAIAKRIVRRLGHGDGNLFTGLAFCTCGATLMLHGGRLVCGGTRKGGSCGFRGAPVRALERALFEFLADARLVRPMLAGEQKPTRMDALAGELADAQKQATKLASVIVGDREPSPLIYAALKAAEARAKSLQAEIETEKSKAMLPAVQAYESFRNGLLKRLNDTAARTELRRGVNGIIERLTLDPRGIGARSPRAWRVVNALVAMTLDGNGGKAAPKAWQVEIRLRGSAQAFVLEFIAGGWRLAGVS